MTFLFLLFQSTSTCLNIIYVLCSGFVPPSYPVLCSHPLETSHPDASVCSPLPSAPYGTAEQANVFRKAADVMSAFPLFCFSFSDGFPFHSYAFQAFPLSLLIHPADVLCLVTLPCLYLAMCFLHFFLYPVPSSNLLRILGSYRHISVSRFPWFPFIAST